MPKIPYPEHHVHDVEKSYVVHMRMFFRVRWTNGLPFGQSGDSFAWCDPPNDTYSRDDAVSRAADDVAVVASNVVDSI